MWWAQHAPPLRDEIGLTDLPKSGEWGSGPLPPGSDSPEPSDGQDSFRI